MPPSEAQKRARQKWDNANMSILSVKIKRDKAEAVRAKASAEGTTVNAVLSALLDAYLSTPSAPAPAEPMNPAESTK